MHKAAVEENKKRERGMKEGDKYSKAQKGGKKASHSNNNNFF